MNQKRLIARISLVALLCIHLYGHSDESKALNAALSDRLHFANIGISGVKSPGTIYKIKLHGIAADFRGKSAIYPVSTFEDGNITKRGHGETSLKVGTEVYLFRSHVRKSDLTITFHAVDTMPRPNGPGVGRDSAGEEVYAVGEVLFPGLADQPIDKIVLTIQQVFEPETGQ